MYVNHAERAERKVLWKRSLGGEVGSDGGDRGTGRRLITSPQRASTPRARATPVLAVENLTESGAEVGIEDCVDDGVEEAVEVAEPPDDTDD